MLGELTRHLWQSTLFALAAGLLTLAFRGNRAQVRYWLWFSASFKFFVPFSLLLSLGSYLGSTPAVHRVAARVATPVTGFNTEQISRELFAAPGFPSAAAVAPSRPDSIDPASIVIAIIWMAGFVVIALMRLAGWRRIRDAVRSSASVEISGLDREVEIRSSQGLVEPGVVGLWRPILLLPAGLVDNLTPAQMTAVLAHELCHVRRRDNLLASIHMIVEAIFWFHPLVWWIGARLVAERERACDEEVLAQLGEPAIYAEGIINVCRLYVESPLVCVSGVTGGGLKRRIEEIMRNHIGRRLSRLNKLLLATAGVVALGAPFVIGVGSAPQVRAQAPGLPPGFVFKQPDERTPRFEIADVHSTGNAPRPTPFIRDRIFRDRYEVRNANMLRLISTAWNVDPDMVTGGPDWLELDRFDVNAKIPPGLSSQTRRLMMQALLADRFKLAMHEDTRPLPAYVLTVGKGKPKLKQSEGSESPACLPAPEKSEASAVPYVVYACRNVTMQFLVEKLREFRDYITIPIVDGTGLQGSWDFDMKWTTRQLIAQAGPSGITELDAIENQLGLRLELKTAPAPALVIDHINERPTGNPPDLPPSLPPAFEVAVIKQSVPGTPGLFRVQPGGTVEIRNATVRNLIVFAWGYFNPDEMIVGTQKALDSNRFDITGKVAAGSERSDIPEVDVEDARLMVGGLLSDRFKLKTHTEDRPVSSYTLVAEKPKLKRADPANRTGWKEAPAAGGKDPRIANPSVTRVVTCRNMTMTQFAAVLEKIAPGYLHSPAVDATGLRGAWDFTISFSTPYVVENSRAHAATGDPQLAGTSAAAESYEAVSLFDALYKQLGLKLKAEKRPLPVLVIDHVEEKPTDN